MCRPPRRTHALRAPRAKRADDSETPGNRIGRRGRQDATDGAPSNDGTGGPGLSRDGDRVILYDGQVTGSPVVDDQSFPVADPASYIYDPLTGQFGALAQAGVLGAYEGTRPAGNGPGLPPPIGSPGMVPEPTSASALTLLACGLLQRGGARGRSFVAAIVL